MFINFFFELRKAKLPVSLREYLTLLEAMDAGLADYSVDDFYYLSRSCLVKDESNLDRFDRVFGSVFKGLEPPKEGETLEIPEEWLRKVAERTLTEEEKAMIQALGGWDRLMETLRQRLAEQKGRHQGGSKWIGTGGTSPFGAWGYNPEGVRIGQDRNRNNRAVKVWDRREFRNLDSSVELGTRNIKVALRRLRRFAREGAATQLDLGGTIDATARRGYLDLKMTPERHNAVKVLLFLDVGGSMDPFVQVCEELFSAARSEFKHLEHFYFHNMLYERVWRDNRRRRTEATATWDVLHTYPHDYKVVFVGDASMSPYEILYPGGSVEHWNDEAGHVWMERLLAVYSHAVWLNPMQEGWWDTTVSTRMVRQLLGGRMYPLTLDGLDRAMRELSR
ncbi:MAG: VWA domain-containing protein [Rhodospirillales bacterium]|nr:MAG: VWA domain-containing protein [Rhodospirillales bacterium]